MTYTPASLVVNRVSGSAKTGWTAVTGVSHSGQSVDLKTPAVLNAVTIRNGYTPESTGALSLDPATATAARTTREHWPGSPDLSTVLNVGDPVEIRYNDVLQFIGKCTDIKITVEAVNGQAFDYTKQVVYTLASVEAILMATTVSYPNLPAEPAVTRLSRWFTVDTSQLSAAHLSYLNEVQAPALSAGSDTLLNLARAFTTQTLLPLRQSQYVDPTQWTNLAVLDKVTVWSDQPLTDESGLTGSAAWLNHVEYTGTPPLPTAVAVKADDTRLTGGQSSTTVGPYYTGTFQTGGSDLTGPAYPVQQGFVVPGVVDVLGTPVVASRVTHNFGNDHYTAALEISMPAVPV